VHLLHDIKRAPGTPLDTYAHYLLMIPLDLASGHRCALNVSRVCSALCVVGAALQVKTEPLSGSSGFDTSDGISSSSSSSSHATDEKNRLYEEKVQLGPSKAEFFRVAKQGKTQIRGGNVVYWQDVQYVVCGFDDKVLFWF
jgi:hypothetical protein